MMKFLKGITAGVFSISLLIAPAMPPSFMGAAMRVEATSTQMKPVYASIETNAYTTRSSKSKRVMTIPYGVRLERTAVNSSWSQIRYKGRTGWVASRDLVEIKKTEVMDAKKALTLYASRSTKSKAVTKVPAAKQVTRLAVNKSWSQVKYGSKTGWVASSQLKARYVKENFAPRSYQLKEEAPLLSTYTTSGTTFTSIPKETIVASAERYNSWYKVTFNKKTGWVNGKYLTAYKAPTDAVSVAKQLFGSAAKVESDNTIYIISSSVYAIVGSGSSSIEKGNQDAYTKLAKVIVARHGGDSGQLASYMWNARPGQKYAAGVNLGKFRITMHPSGGAMVTW